MRWCTSPNHAASGPGEKEAVVLTHQKIPHGGADGDQRRSGAANTPGTLAFRITGPSGDPVTAFTDQHEKQLHLIVVRTDISAFRHVHPAMATDGTWSIDWAWPTGGAYRVFLDFQHENTVRTAEFTVEADGTTAPASPEAPAGHGH